MLLLAVPLLALPELLYLPCSYLFAGKFLFGPAVGLLYDDDRRPALVLAAGPQRRFVLFSLLVALGSAAGAPAEAAEQFEIRGKEIRVNGKPFVVKGVHYGPWRPGTGPNRKDPFPARELVSADLRLIRGLNANTIVVHNPPGYVLDLAAEQGLEVLCTFYIDWHTFGTPQGTAARNEILSRVRELRAKPAALGWVLGHEIPSHTLEQRGQKTLEGALRALYEDVKRIDGKHPAMHSGWPPTRDLDLGFFDLASFNLYPLWPPEVVARGFGTYIEEVLQPLAGERPLLITEFGVNTIEAGEKGQAQTLRECWQGLRKAGACGGVVFEFADEWWKNYDNPRRSGSWWDRVSAPEDERRHDQDPEEHYGIMTAARQPKPAFTAVREFYAERDGPAGLNSLGGRAIPAVIIGLLLLVAGFAWIWARRSMQPLEGRAAQQGTIGGPGQVERHRGGVPPLEAANPSRFPAPAGERDAG